MRSPVSPLCLLCAAFLAAGCAKTRGVSPASTPAPARGPASSATIRATIANDCPRPVNVTFGREPPDEHAEITSLPAGSEQTRQLDPDERLWLVRDDGTWAAGASVDQDGGRITILATCSAIGTAEDD